MCTEWDWDRGSALPLSRNVRHDSDFQEFVFFYRVCGDMCYGPGLEAVSVPPELNCLFALVKCQFETVERFVLFRFG